MLALTLVAVGLLVNFWFVIIGVFIYLGGSAEEAATIVHVRVRGVRIADVMLLDPVVVEPTTDIADLRALLRRSAQRAFPVVGTDGYEGMIDAIAVERTPPGYLASHLTKPVDAVDAHEQPRGRAPTGRELTGQGDRGLRRRSYRRAAAHRGDSASAVGPGDARRSPLG